MAEPRGLKGNRVESLPNVRYEAVARNPFTGAAVAYRGVPTGERTRVRANRTEAETLEQMRRMYERYGSNARAARAYARTVNAMMNRNRWGIV